MKKTVVMAATFGVLLLSMFSFIAQMLILLSAPAEHPGQPQATVTARASTSAYASVCINHPPVLSIPCNATMSQGAAYYCRLNGTDYDAGQNLTYNATFLVGALPSQNSTFFNITADGVINFTPSNGDVGNHTVNFSVADDSGCINNLTTQLFNFSVMNINDPPYLVMSIPDQQLIVNTTLSAFFLSNYFYDPDIPYGDRLAYTVVSTASGGINVTVMNTSEVLFTSNVCDENGEVFKFIATESDGDNVTGNQSAISNVVTVKVTCPKPSSGVANTQGTKIGGGSGGGAVSVCKENWECDDWLACLPTNFQWQRCYDTHGCKPDKYFKRQCTFVGPPPACKENWLCVPWNKCLLNDTQYRTCKDLEDCGTTVVRPPLEQKCNYIPTCNDGIQNGNETGVDCGGDCPACPIVQQPTAITGNAGLSAWLLMAIIISILLVSGILRYYRAQLAQAIASIGFLLKHRAYKDILLDAPQRKSYFERILALEQLLQTDAGKRMAPSTVYSTMSTLIRQYIGDALALPLEALPEEVDARCQQLGLRPETTTLLHSLFQKLAIVEQEDLEYDEYFVRATLEELRTIVCLTSDYRHDELLRAVEEVPLNDKMSFYDEIFARMMNVMRALQFDQLEAAKKEYLALLTRYDPLSETEKEQIYPELRWVFDSVKFGSEMTGAKIIKKPALETATA